MSFTARPRHPVTGERFVLRASSKGELAAYVQRLGSLRTELKLGMRSEQEIDRELRHMKHGAIALERVVRAYLARPDLADNTRRGMRSLLAEHLAELGPRPFASLDGPTVHAWIEALARGGMAASSVDASWRKLRALARYASERGWIGAVPWGNYKPRRTGGQGRPPREAARTAEELVRLFEAAQDLDAESDPYTGLAAKILVAALLGLRQGELAGLRWSDLAWGPPLVVTIARQWDGQPLKTRAPTRIEGMSEVRSQLVAHRCALEHQGLYAERGPVFPGPGSERGRPRAYAGGEPISRLQLRSAVARAHLPHDGAFGSWSAHGLRDTFITLEVSAAGGDLTLVQPRSRHASLATLGRYVRTLNRTMNPPSPLLRCLPGISGDDGGLPLSAK